VNVPPAIFVTGTDTGIGKTVATGAIALCLQAAGYRVAPYKPAQTGWDDAVTGDAVFVQQLLGNEEPLDAVCPYRLRDALAPAVAARREGVTIDIARIRSGFESLRARYDVVLVEGAGGLLVSLTDAVHMADLALDLALPLVIVARPGLGTINHTALTVEAARRRGLEVLGVIISGYPPEPGLAAATNPAEIIRQTGAPLIGVLPLDEGIDTEGGRPGSIRSWAAASLGPILAGTFDGDAFVAGLGRYQ
jgi:dethiobiotin synthetase